MKDMTTVHSRMHEVKQFLKRVVQYFGLLALFSAVVAGGVMMSEQSLIQKQKLEEKKSFLERDNRFLGLEIKSLEREITLLSSDPGTIEKAAKRKLGMARPDETVYLLERNGSSGFRTGNSRHGLGKEHNSP